MKRKVRTASSRSFFREGCQPKVKEGNMRDLPDPKVIVDSVVDGAVEVVEGPVKAAENVNAVVGTFLSEVKANMESFKGALPDSPDVIPDIAIKAAGQTINAGIGLFEGVGKAALDTVSGVKNQIRRVTG